MNDDEGRVSEMSLSYLLNGMSRLEVRMEALEKRVHHLEDKVREILQRRAGIGRLVQAANWPPDSEQFPPDTDAKG